MIDLTATHYFAPLLVMLAVFVISYIVLKKSQVPGPNWVMVVLSLLIALIFVSSTSLTNYTISLLPIITLIITLGFFAMLAVALFVTKDFAPFSKIIAWLGFIMVILVILCLAFQQFPTMNHMLPSSSNSGLSSNLIDFKNFIYSSVFTDNLIFVVSVVVVGFFLLSSKK